MILDALTTALADRYRLEREVGEGGMATVYLAHDIRHDRQVAIKVLRPELAAVIGADRFLTEIKTTANLQHPHILPLFDSGAADSFLFYVMPFVEGESLRDRLDREKQLPIADAVRITTEVADALDYAHRHGVVHRDIKPENILLHDGRALVADFGIALAASSAGSRMTETGMSLGTPTYMSPEQAMGERTLDARTDVYALGCVLYEMLVGDPPFLGSTAQAIVAKVMTEKPAPPSRLRDTVSEQLDDAVQRALEKLPADRFASAAEFAAALRGGTIFSTAARHVRPAPTSTWRRASIALGGIATAACVVAIWALAQRGGTAGPQVYDVGLPDSARMSFTGSTSRVGAYGALMRNVAIGPSGDFVVYAALVGDSTFLWYRSLRTEDVHILPGTGGATGPRISADGSQVAFFADRRIMLTSLDDKEPRQLMEAVNSTVIGWDTPTRLIVVDNDGYRANWVDPGAGDPRPVPISRCALGSWDAALGELICSFNGIATVINPEQGTTVAIRTANTDGTPGALVAGTAFRVIDQQYLLWLAVDGTLTAARYDKDTHLAHRAVSLRTGVPREALGEGQFDVSGSGTLVFAPGIDATIGHLVRLTAGGTPEPLPMESGDFQRYDLSTDGRWLAAVTRSTDGNELRIYDLRDGQRFVWQRAEAMRHPIWDPNGEHLLFAAQNGDAWHILRGSPGSGQPVDTLATFGADARIDPMGYPSDSVAVGQDWEGSVVVRFDPRATHPTIDTVLTGARFPSVSANQRLIAYQTLEETRIVVTSFPTPGRRWQIASSGVEPIWLSPSELLYRYGAVWYLARVNPETGEPLGAATLWARDPRFSDTSGWSNRPDHRGGIIYVQSPEQASPTFLRVIPNWVSQMKQAVDAANK